MAILPGTKGWNPKPIADQPAKDTRGKVNLRPDQFDALVEKQGVRVKVYRTAFCPQVKSCDGAEHEINCNLCQGSGYIDRYCIETWAFIQNQTSEKRLLGEGHVDGNTVAATFMRGIELQYFTLVELLDFTEAFFERVKRQDGRLDVLKYPGVRVNLVVDSRGKEYFEGSDFNLDPNGNVLWCTEKGPERGVIYSINYEMKVRFRAVKAMHSNRFGQIAAAGATKLMKLNEQWALSKVFLVQRRDSLGQEIPVNKIRNSDDFSAGAEEADGYGVDGVTADNDY